MRRNEEVVVAGPACCVLGLHFAYSSRSSIWNRLAPYSSLGRHPKPAFFGSHVFVSACRLIVHA